MNAAWLRRMRLLMAIALVLSVTLAHGQEKPLKPNDAKQRFDKLLAAAKQEPAKADWKALRHAFAETAEYKPYDIGWKETFSKALDALKQGDLKTAEKSVVELLDHDRFMRIDAHALAINVYEKTKQKDKIALHKGFIEGISSTLFVPGTGMSFEKPIEVLFIDEEYMFLSALGLKPNRQGLTRKNNHSYDVFKIEPKDGIAEHMMYFNVDLPQKSLHRMLEQMEKPEPKDKT